MVPYDRWSRFALSDVLSSDLGALSGHVGADLLHSPAFCSLVTGDLNVQTFYVSNCRQIRAVMFADAA